MPCPDGHPPTRQHLPPRATARSIAALYASTARAEMSGPSSTPSSSGLPIFTVPYARTSLSSSASATPLSTKTRRVDVHRCPAVPTAPNVIARAASSRSASFSTRMPLFPPSSSKLLPSRRATETATFRPASIDPVNETSGNRLSSAIFAERSALPTRRLHTPPASCAAIACVHSPCTAIAHSGASGDGFHTQTSPQTAASAAFQAHTAIGKLNAVTTATGPRGCHCSIIRCPARSDAITSPWSCRDSPTAKSQISIISCTSPSPSDRIFPTSSEISSPRASLFARRSSPRVRTTSARFGAGRVRHSRNRASASPTSAS